LKSKENKIKLFDLYFDTVTLQQAVRILITAAERGTKSLVVTPNVDHIVQLHKNQDLKDLYKTADFVYVDGMPLVWFSRLLPRKYHLPERVNGTNLMIQICAVAAKTGLSVAFLGGSEGAAKEAGSRLENQYPGLKVAGHFCPPYGFEDDLEVNQKIIDLTHAWKPDFLFVGIGNPKQEKWIHSNWKELSFKIAMGVGSAIDLVAGQITRAPIWMQESGLEWLWRLMQEPRRLWRRYLVQDLLFIPIAWREYWRIILTSRQ
jgi:N-acetylglucosaminyldiphosphoundecaprenol N-acetyl-beta-D-mannosaminyltransferase